MKKAADSGHPECEGVSGIELLYSTDQHEEGFCLLKHCADCRYTWGMLSCRILSKDQETGMKYLRGVVDGGNGVPRMTTLYGINLLTDRHPKEEMLRCLSEGVDGENRESCLVSGFSSPPKTRTAGVRCLSGRSPLIVHWSRNLSVAELRHIFKAGADLGVPKAQCRFWAPAGAPAREYLERAATAWVAEAQFQLARTGSPEGMALCIAATGQDHLEAMTYAGVLLRNCGPTDVAKGAGYLRKVAQQGSLRAMGLLAHHLETRDPKQASKGG
jgi:TPR repeat protein